MFAHVLLKGLRKRDEMGRLHSILLLFRNKFS